MFLVFRPKLASGTIPERIDLSVEEIRHLRARRLGPQQTIYIGDGHTRRWPASLMENGRQASIIGMSVQRLQPMQFPKLLCFSLPEPNRLYKFLPAAVELGMSYLQPLICEHSVRFRLSVYRAKRIIEEAAIQSECFFLPRLLRPRKPSDLQAIFKRLETSRQNFARQYKQFANPRNILVLHKSAKFSFDDYLHSSIDYRQEAKVIFVGPEGDFSQQEIKKFIDSGYQLIHLGPNILRVCTAGLAALAKLL